MGLDGSGVIVAVVDSHIDNRHSDLDDNFLRHYDASGTGVVANNKYGNHGTLCRWNYRSRTQWRGDAWRCSWCRSHRHIIWKPVRWADHPSLSDLGTSITSAVEDGARIFNNSYGGRNNLRAGQVLSLIPPLRKSVADAIDKGAVFVWSAGNSYSENTILGDNNTSEHAKAALKYPNWREDSSMLSIWLGIPAILCGPLPTLLGSGANRGSQICGVTKNYCLGAPGTFIISTKVGNAK